MTRKAIGRAIGFAAAVGAVVAVYSWLSHVGVVDEAFTNGGPQRILKTLGGWGPVAIVGLMALAIVVSPLPSAPVAIAAGALYGHTFGTLYVALGSLGGAVAAFSIARLTGVDAVGKLVGRGLPLRPGGSQSVLMAIVFATRLMPFVSFDVISYAAGLTPLRLWRFVVATALGILPASFFLAHVGSGLASYDAGEITTALVLLGAASAVTAIVGRIVARRRSGMPDGE